VKKGVKFLHLSHAVNLETRQRTSQSSREKRISQHSPNNGRIRCRRVYLILSLDHIRRRFLENFEYIGGMGSIESTWVTDRHPERGIQCQRHCIPEVGYYIIVPPVGDIRCRDIPPGRDFRQSAGTSGSLTEDRRMGRDGSCGREGITFRDTRSSLCPQGRRLDSAALRLQTGIGGHDDICVGQQTFASLQLRKTERAAT